MHLWPSHQADDMGAKFALPYSLLMEIIVTGVPQYRIAGEMVRCIGSLLAEFFAR